MVDKYRSSWWVTLGGPILLCCPTPHQPLCYYFYMSTSTQNVGHLIKDAMLEADIVAEKNNTLNYSHAGQEYLVSILVVNVTGWEKEI